MYDYVAKYKETRRMLLNFIQQIKGELAKTKPLQIEINAINSLIEDIFNKYKISAQC